MLTIDCRPKADTDGKRTGNDRDILQIEADIGERDHAGDDDADIADRGSDRRFQTDIELCARKETRLDPALDGPCRDDAADEDGKGSEDRGKRKLHLADLDAEKDGFERAEEL